MASNNHRNTRGKAFPRYADLPRPDHTDIPLAWGVWGANDQLGMLNNLDPEKVASAARLVTEGQRFNLNLPLHVPLGTIGHAAHAVRRPPHQTLFKLDYAGLIIRDDKIDDFYPQASTQWDGLTHIADPVHGFYNAVQDEEVTQLDGTRNGIENFVRFGIATRAVLVDLPRFFKSTGRQWLPNGSHVATASDIQSCLQRQGTTLQQGDLLLVRTGWLHAFRAAKNDDIRGELFASRDYSGLSGGLDMWQFLWDHRVIGAASDAVTVEAWPLQEHQPSLHLAIARMGLLLGEMFDLETLAENAERNKQYDYFFVSVPLNLRGGVGSPANAMALR